MAPKKKSIQIAIGSNIAQASEGATAKIEVVQTVHSILPACAPPPSQYFVGRDNELGYLTKILLQKKHRVSTVAILGMGGIGKTALTLRLAEEVTTSYPGGIFWADFGDSEGDPLPVVSYWANLCGMGLGNIADPTTRAQILRSLLIERQRRSGGLLFILDDVRLDWIEGARFLRTCFPPKASVVVTSREMQVAQTLRALPYSLGLLSSAEARELVERLSSLQIRGMNADQIAALCGFVPLAIELASAVAMQEGPAWLIERLSDSKKRLKTLALDDPNRKEDSIRLSFEISYRALSERHPETARVFRWLGVFANYNLCPARIAGVLTESDEKEPYSTEARFLIDVAGRIPSRDEANRIAEDIEEHDQSDGAKLVADLLRKSIAWPEFAEFEEVDISLRRLHSWNLFRHHPAHGEKGDHYTIHPLLKDYAITLLESVGDSQSARKAFVTHYLKFAWTYPRVEPISFLRAEYRNIVTAMEYSYEDENWDDYFRLVKLLCLKDGSLRQLSSIDEVRLHLRQAADAAERLEDREKYILFGFEYANLLASIGDFESSLTEHRRIHPLIEESGNQGAISSGNLSLGILALEMGNLDDAERLLVASLEGFEELGDKHGIASALAELALISVENEDYSRARNDLERSIAIFQDLKDEEAEATSLFQLAYVTKKEGSHSEAERLYQMLLQKAEEKGDLLGIAKCSVNLADLYDCQGRSNEALPLMETAYRIFESYKSPYAEKIRPALENLRKNTHREH